MRTNILTVIIIGLMLFICCSYEGNIAGGGTDVANGNVVGTISNSDGSPGANVQVYLIQKDFNPVEDGALPDSLVDTTDENGVFRFRIDNKDIYNIQAVHLTQRTRLLITGVIIDQQTDTVSVSGTVKVPGVLQVILPEIIDTMNGYLFIHGSFIAKDFYNNISVGSDNKPQLVIDSVPASLSALKLYYGLKSTDIEKLIADSITIETNEITVANVSEYDLKPLWKFPLVIGVTTKTLQYYNGFDAVKELIIEQMNNVENRFNDPGIFDGLFYFSPDSFYEITGAVDDENIQTPPGFAFRVIYDGFNEGNLGNWRKGKRIIIHNYRVDEPNGMFGKEATEDLTWIFGLARGCVILRYMKIEADSNHISHEAYNGIASLMSDHHTYTTWDEYSISLINGHGSVDSIFPEIKFSAFPQSIGFIADSSTGNPMVDVVINVYGIIPREQRTTDTALVSGITDQNGEFILSENLYLNTAESKFAYYNFLVEAINNTDTAYAWFPVTDVSNAYFANPDTTFRLKFIF